MYTQYPPETASNRRTSRQLRTPFRSLLVTFALSMLLAATVTAFPVLPAPDAAAAPGDPVTVCYANDEIGGYIDTDVQPKLTNSALFGPSGSVSNNPMIMVDVGNDSSASSIGACDVPTLSNNEREDHARIRRNTQAAFRPQHFSNLEPYIRELVNRAVDSFEADGRADLVRQMVYELSAHIFILPTSCSGIPNNLNNTRAGSS